MTTASKQELERLVGESAFEGDAAEIAAVEEAMREDLLRQEDARKNKAYDTPASERTASDWQVLYEDQRDAAAALAAALHEQQECVARYKRWMLVYGKRREMYYQRHNRVHLIITGALEITRNKATQALLQLIGWMDSENGYDAFPPPLDKNGNNKYPGDLDDIPF